VDARASGDGAADSAIDSPPGPDAPVTGSLTGSHDSADGLAVNLTAEGTTDWAEWGMTAATDFNHSLGGGGKIANATPINTTTVYGYGNAYMQAGNDGFSWADGTPTAATTSAQYSGIYVAGQTRGLETTVPAGTTQRTLKLYVGGYFAAGTLTAHLSDGSAPDYVDSTLGSVSSSYAGVYTLVFRSTSPSATLTVRWVQNSNSGGDVNWSAASLY